MVHVWTEQGVANYREYGLNSAPAAGDIVTAEQLTRWGVQQIKAMLESGDLESVEPSLVWTEEGVAKHEEYGLDDAPSIGDALSTEQLAALGAQTLQNMVDDSHLTPVASRPAPLTSAPALSTLESTHPESTGMPQPTTDPSQPATASTPPPSL